MLLLGSLVLDGRAEHVKEHCSGAEPGRGTDAERRAFRPIGINRHNALAILQIRGDLPAPHRSVQWIAYASLPFTTLIPMLTNVEEAPARLSTTGETVSTDSFYWTSRMIAALAGPHFHEVIPLIERYQQRTLALGRSAVRTADEEAARARYGGRGAGPARRSEHPDRRADPHGDRGAARPGAVHGERGDDQPVLAAGRVSGAARARAHRRDDADVLGRT
ncbi:C69 family dipeptidase [Brachybacterium paraconglomeratum]|uniref:C69 family dipeptidase n=1 Tax=Brachybacterium paraconglomeratum TaxID=173362 RepID=UPI00387999AF